MNVLPRNFTFIQWLKVLCNVELSLSVGTIQTDAQDSAHPPPSEGLEGLKIERYPIHFTQNDSAQVLEKS